MNPNGEEKVDKLLFFVEKLRNMPEKRGKSDKIKKNDVIICRMSSLFVSSPQVHFLRAAAEMRRVVLPDTSKKPY